MDLHGSQLWNYGTGYPEAFYVARRKVTRLICKQPFGKLVHIVIYYIQLIIVILLNSYSKNVVLNFSTLVYGVTI